MVDLVRLSPPAELAMSIGEAMFTQRAIRKLKPDPIGDEQLKLIMDAAAKAPNGVNFQPARFLVIRDPARIRAFARPLLARRVRSRQRTRSTFEYASI